VYAVGSERGLHYYAMQFIEVQSLATLIGQLLPLSRDPARQPPARPVAYAEPNGPYGPSRLVSRTNADNCQFVCQDNGIGLDMAHNLPGKHKVGYFF